MQIIDSIIKTCQDNLFLIVCIIILLILGVVIKINYPKFRKFMSELGLKDEFKKLGTDYISLNNIVIEDEKGKHKIDYIVLSPYGIFVIIIKNYSGLITGLESDKEWCQQLGKKKELFNNPIYENNDNIEALSKLLQIDSYSFIPIICFPNKSTVAVETNSIIAINDNLVDEIKNYSIIKNEYTLEDLEKIIKDHNNVDNKNIKETDSKL